jgi:hypothetical protein
MFPSANVILSRVETKILERLFIKLKSYKIHYDISADGRSVEVKKKFLSGIKSEL